LHESILGVVDLGKQNWIIQARNANDFPLFKPS